MTRRLAVAVAIAALAVLAVPAQGSAHNVKVSPKFGTTGDDFFFYGTFWQKVHRVRWFYDQHDDGDFDQTGRFFTGTKGKSPSGGTGEDVTDPKKMCSRSSTCASR